MSGTLCIVLWIVNYRKLFYSPGELCSVTDVSTFDDFLVSVGEDGRINVVSLAKENEVLRSIGKFSI